jgi:predicted transcriptional regulator
VTMQRSTNRRNGRYSVNKLPKCLHTCLHCRHAVISEEYNRYSRALVYNGCWKFDDFRLPVKRKDCDKFEESEQRTKIKFWQKWNWKVYIDGDLVELDPIEDEPHEQSHEQGDDQQSERARKQEHEQNRKNPATRALILQALANNVCRLKDIAYFAGVDPSTAHYHLRNLIRQGRAAKISWGKYAFPYEQPMETDRRLRTNDQFFEDFLRNSSQQGKESGGSIELHPVEKNILVDILSKENKYELFSERELARRSNISRYAARKYTRKLEKKKLIEIKKESGQLVLVPTEIAINGLAEFFQSVRNSSIKNDSKIRPIDDLEDQSDDTENSKIRPIVRPIRDTNQPANSSKKWPIPEVNTEPDPAAPDSEDVLQTFEDHLTWQQKNTHRLFMQFKLLRCDHSRLRGTGWIFGQKSIHKHFSQAYIFKSKDPKGEFVNVLPKHPIIFTSPFEFHDQILALVNEIIERLHTYGVVIDLSEPAQVRMQHVALEDDLFARKIIEKKLLYFKSKVVTIDSTGEAMEYVIAIDKSKKLHLEIEGREACQLMENYEEFIDDVVTKRIDPKFLRELPGQNQKIEEEIQQIQERQTAFDDNLNFLSETAQFYSENIRAHIDSITTLTKSVDQSTEASKKIEKAAEAVEKAAESLIEATHVLKEISGKAVLYHSNARSD